MANTVWIDWCCWRASSRSTIKTVPSIRMLVVGIMATFQWYHTTTVLSTRYSRSREEMISSGISERSQPVKPCPSRLSAETISSTILDRLRREQKEHPRVLVEAPTAIVNQELDALPSGVDLSPGRIVLDGFSTPEEAKQKLLTLIMAMSNDPDGFDARITVAPR